MNQTIVAIRFVVGFVSKNSSLYRNLIGFKPGQSKMWLPLIKVEPFLMLNQDQHGKWQILQILWTE